MRDAGVDFEAVDYYTDPISRAKLKDLLRKMGMSPRQLLRTKEDVYRKLRLGEREVTDDQVLDLMVQHPDLIQRPIVERGSRAILARPAERCARFYRLGRAGSRDRVRRCYFPAAAFCCSYSFLS